MERATIIITGRVQKAGYRDFIDEAAFDLGLTGRVRNLADGSVEVVCEGRRSDIPKFMEKIRIKQYPISVENIEVKYSKATGEYKDFVIIREDDLTAAVYERMDAAGLYMRELNKDLGEKITSGNKMLGEKIDSGNKMLGEKIDSGNKMLGEKIDSGNKMLGEKIDSGNKYLGGKMDSVGSKLDMFHQDTIHRFDVVDEKYGRISENLDKAVASINKTSDNIEKILEKSEKDRKEFHDRTERMFEVIMKLVEKKTG